MGARHIWETVSKAIRLVRGRLLRLQLSCIGWDPGRKKRAQVNLSLLLTCNEVCQVSTQLNGTFLKSSFPGEINCIYGCTHTHTSTLSSISAYTHTACCKISALLIAEQLFICSLLCKVITVQDCLTAFVHSMPSLELGT